MIDMNQFKKGASNGVLCPRMQVRIKVCRLYECEHHPVCEERGLMRSSLG